MDTSDLIDRIKQLEAQRDGLLRVVTDNHIALQRAEAAEAALDETYIRGFSAGQTSLQKSSRLVIIDSPELAALRAELDNERQHHVHTEQLWGLDRELLSNLRNNIVALNESFDKLSEKYEEELIRSNRAEFALKEACRHIQALVGIRCVWADPQHDVTTKPARDFAFKQGTDK